MDENSKQNIFQQDPAPVDEVIIQPWPLAIKRLLNKPYENEVTLTGQNPPLKKC